jgi:hypothetical protein
LETDQDNILIQFEPLNMIILGKIETDNNINQIIAIRKQTRFYEGNEWLEFIWSLKPIDNIDCDHINLPQP